MDRSFVLALLVASALLTNSIWLFPHATEDRYTYRTSTLAVSESGPAGAELAGARPVVGLDCDDDAGRACAVETRLAVQGNTSDGPPPGLITGADETYLFAGEGRLYRRTDVVAPGSAVYSWERVTAAEVAADIAVPPEQLPDDVATAVRTGGSVTRHRPLDIGLWSDPDENYIVGPVEAGSARYRVLTVSSYSGASSEVVLALRAVLGLLGAAVLVGERRSLGTRALARFGRWLP